MLTLTPVTSIRSRKRGSEIPARNVSEMPGATSRVVVKLKDLSHTYPDDLDILLVGPGGQKVLLMSDAGGISPNNTWQLFLRDDDAQDRGSIVSEWELTITRN